MNLMFGSHPFRKLEEILKELAARSPSDIYLQKLSDKSLATVGNLLNTIFDKFHQEITEQQKQIQLLKDENTKLSEHAKTLTEQKQQLSSESYSVEVQKENLEAQYEKLTNFMAGVTEGIIALDSRRRVVFFNPAAARITGFTESYALGKDIGNLMSVFDKSTLIAPAIYFPTGINNHQGIVFQKQNIKLIGNTRTAYVNMTANIVPTSHEHLCIITLEDVTAENELQKIKLDFVSMAAHELRTPLTTIRGYLSFLQDTTTSSKLTTKERDYLTRSAISAVRLNELIENLLAVSKIEQGKLIIDPTPMDIAPLLQKIVNEYKLYAEYKNLTLKYQAPEKLPLVLADSTRIEEVLINLLGNALNFTQEGHIDVAVALSPEVLQISISDTGIGIPADKIPQLFTKFYRVQGNVESGAKGTGLGLYICKTIIDAHHGKIWVESIDGQGSTFYFTLPIQPA